MYGTDQKQTDQKTVNFFKEPYCHGSYSVAWSSHFPTSISDMATEGNGQGRTSQATESKSRPVGKRSQRAEAGFEGGETLIIPAQWCFIIFTHLRLLGVFHFSEWEFYFVVVCLFLFLHHIMNQSVRISNEMYILS